MWERPVLVSTPLWQGGRTTKRTEKKGRKGSKGKVALKDLDLDTEKSGLENDEGPGGGLLLGMQSKDAVGGSRAERPDADDEARVAFVVFAPEAKAVNLAGDFNGWDCRSIPMREKRQGLWAIDLRLRPGTYEYRVLVDGQWIDGLRGGVAVDDLWVQDLPAASQVSNPYGSHNTVIRVSPIPSRCSQC